MNSAPSLQQASFSAQAKAAMRAAMLARRAGAPVEQRTIAAGQVAGQAALVDSLAAGGVISGFCSIRDELDPMPLLQALAATGNVLALPRVAGAHLAFHRWSPGDPLKPGRYGIPEPLSLAETVRPDLMLVPLLAFDRRGHRLGYGAGFYDRAIAALRPAVTMGVAFAMQEVEAMPDEAHDMPLDFVLTDAGLIDCHSARGA